MSDKRRFLTRLLIASCLAVPGALVGATGAAHATGVELYISSPPPPAVVGQAYSFQLQVGGGGTPPYTFTTYNTAIDPDAPGPPAGLSISASGLISGTPVLAENSEWGYNVSDSAGNSSGGRYLSMTVSTGNAALDAVLIPIDTNALRTAGSSQASVVSQLTNLLAVIVRLPSQLLCIIQTRNPRECGP